MYSRVYDKVMQGLEEKGPIVQWLYGVAYANQSWCKSMGFSNPLWDLIVFNRYDIASKMLRPKVFFFRGCDVARVESKSGRSRVPCE